MMIQPEGKLVWKLCWHRKHTTTVFEPACSFGVALQGADGVEMEVGAKDLGDPFLLSTHLRKPLYLRCLSMCLFSRTFQKVQSGVIFAVWDVCPQADRRVSSGIL